MLSAPSVCLVDADVVSRANIFAALFAGGTGEVVFCRVSRMPR